MKQSSSLVPALLRRRHDRFRDRAPRLRPTSIAPRSAEEMRTAVLRWLARRGIKNEKPFPKSPNFGSAAVTFPRLGTSSSG